MLCSLRKSNPDFFTWCSELGEYFAPEKEYIHLYSIYIYICASIVSVYIYMYIHVYIDSICISIYLSIYLSTYLPVCIYR